MEYSDHHGSAPSSGSTQGVPERSAAIPALLESAQSVLSSPLQDAHQKVEHLEAAAKLDPFTLERLTFERHRLNRIPFARICETRKGTPPDLLVEGVDGAIGEPVAALHLAAAKVPPAGTPLAS